jgi:hypothetical protein
LHLDALAEDLLPALAIPAQRHHLITSSSRPLGEAPPDQSGGTCDNDPHVPILTNCAASTQQVVEPQSTVELCDCWV